MATLHTPTILFSLVLALGPMTISSTTEKVSIPPVVIPGDGADECPSDADRQDGLQVLKSKAEQVLQNFSSNSNCGPGLWRRVFYFNASSGDQSCPGDWNAHTVTSLRGCAGADISCQSAYSEDIGSAYNKVCGRITGIGGVSPDGFYRYISGQTTIEGNYLEGVSVTHGAPGSRTHIWTFGAGHLGRCPCDSSNRSEAPLPPSEVGENYFCSRYTTSSLLWTGTDCTSDNPCCSLHNPPYFSVQLPTPTTDQIELRICTDQENELVTVLLAEMFIQ